MTKAPGMIRRMALMVQTQEIQAMMPITTMEKVASWTTMATLLESPSWMMLVSELILEIKSPLLLVSKKVTSL